MKKALFALLFSLASLLAVPNALAGGEQVLEPVLDPTGREAYLTSYALCGEPYLLSGRGYLYVFDEGNAALTHIPLSNHNPEHESLTDLALKQAGIAEGAAVPEGLIKDAKGIQRIVGDGKTLYGINTLTGALYTLSAEKQGATLYGKCRLDLSSHLGLSGRPDINGLAVTADYLYALMKWEDESGYGCLYRFSLSTGQREPVDDSGTISEIANCTPTGILLLKEESAPDTGIFALDAATNEQRLLHQNVGPNAIGLIYDAARERIVIQTADTLIAFDGEGKKTVGYFLEDRGFCRGLLPSGHLLLAALKVYVRDISEEKTPQKPLVIACDSLRYIISPFLEDNIDIRVTHIQMFSHKAAEQFSSHMNIRHDGVDIYELPIGGLLEQAIDKGFYVPLSDSPEIAAFTQGLYPFIYDPVAVNNQIVALPKDLYHQTIAYSQYALRSLGLQEEDLPKTHAEFVTFCLNWKDTYEPQAQDAGIALFDLDSRTAQQTLLDLVTEQYFAYLAGDLQNALAHEDELVALLDLLAKLPPALSGLPVASNVYDSETRYVVNDEPSYLFSLHASFNPAERSFSSYGHSMSDFVPLNLPLFAGEVPLYQITGTVLVINPYSANKEAALKFLAYYAQNYPNREGAPFIKDLEQVEALEYRQLKSRYAHYIATFKEQLKIAPPDERQDIELLISQNEKNLQSVELIRWEVSATHIEAYQHMLATSRAVWYDELKYAPLLNSIYKAFINNRIDAKGYATELIRLFNLISAE